MDVPSDGKSVRGPVCGTDDVVLMSKNPFYTKNV